VLTILRSCVNGFGGTALTAARNQEMRKQMEKQTATRWDAFTPWELQALDEFFRSFGPLRNYNRDVSKIGDEIAAAMRRRDIPPFGSS
jgi:hypothetical protein